MSQSSSDPSGTTQQYKGKMWRSWKSWVVVAQWLKHWVANARGPRFDSPATTKIFSHFSFVSLQTPLSEKVSIYYYIYIYIYYIYIYIITSERSQNVGLGFIYIYWMLQQKNFIIIIITIIIVIMNFIWLLLLLFQPRMPALYIYIERERRGRTLDHFLCIVWPLESMITAILTSAKYLITSTGCKTW